MPIGRALATRRGVEVRAGDRAGTSCLSRISVRTADDDPNELGRRGGSAELGETSSGWARPPGANSWIKELAEIWPDMTHATRLRPLCHQRGAVRLNRHLGFNSQSKCRDYSVIQPQNQQIVNIG